MHLGPHHLQIALTYIQDQLPSFDAASSGGIILQRLGQTVEGFELLIILLVLHLKGKGHSYCLLM